MKKLMSITIIMISTLVLVSCSSQNQSSSSQNGTTETVEEKTYDQDFIISLGKGLEDRWKFSDSGEFSDSAENYEKIVQKELDQVEEFANKKFEDTTMQELALSYINELKKGKEVSTTFGADSFYTNWSEHQNRRTELLTQINDLKPIVVSNESILKELLSQGKEVESENKKDQDIKDLVSSITFTQDVEHTDEYTKWYVATVRNTTDYDISHINLVVNVINSDGVTVESTYTYASNWKSGSENFFEVMVTTGQNFEKLEVNLESYLID